MDVIIAVIVGIIIGVVVTALIVRTQLSGNLRVDHSIPEDNPLIRYVIFAQGCPHHCIGCHNPSTHSFADGKLVTIHELLSDIEKNRKYIDGITLSGGEPFCQSYQCSIIAREAHQMGLSVWCYTGYIFEELYGQSKYEELLRHVDVLVDGPFILPERSLDLDFRGSTNQRIIDVRESFKKGVTTLKIT